jgi:hypothetical protein
VKNVNKVEITVEAEQEKLEKLYEFLLDNDYDHETQMINEESNAEIGLYKVICEETNSGSKVCLDCRLFYPNKGICNLTKHKRGQMMQACLYFSSIRR